MSETEIDQIELRLLSWLESKDKEERLVAAMGLSATRKPEFIEPIVNILDKITWDEVDDLAGSLCLFNLPIAPHLISLLPTAKKSTAACAMRTLGLIGGAKASEALVEQLITLPTKGEPTEALVTMREQALPFLTPLLTHSKADVRAVAAYAIGKIGDKSSLPILENMAQTDKSEKVREVSDRAVSWVRGELGCVTDLRNSFGAIELGSR